MSKFYPLTVAQVKHETRDAIAVTFDVPPNCRTASQYQQGQHLTLRAMIDGEDVRRSYSICSAVQDERCAWPSSAPRRPVLDLGQRTSSPA
jgi:ring-1,2-phenylacetyl-CoA epoxidase subunit PaaE